MNRAVKLVERNGRQQRRLREHPPYTQQIQTLLQERIRNKLCQILYV